MRTSPTLIPAKRPKIGILDADINTESDESEDEEIAEPVEKSSKKFSTAQTECAVDITEKLLIERMNPILAAELVLVSTNSLMRDIPPHFHHIYTPIAAARTEGQVNHNPRLLAAQLTAANIGPVVEETKVRRRRNESTSKLEETADDQMMDTKDDKMTILVVGSLSLDVNKESKDPRSIKNETITLLPAGISKYLLGLVHLN